MNLSRSAIVWALGALGAAASACSSSSFQNCASTKSCASQGTDGGVDGTAGGAGTGSGGTAGAAGTAGAGGNAGAAGSGGTQGADHNGTPCSSASTCASGFCADGVCCDTACKGACESCDAQNAKGTCTPYASGTDPEGECLGNATSAGDTCAGKCDGNGACKFPGTTTSCGASTCTGGSETDKACSGDGACNATTASCGKYACGPATCKTSCGGNGDCASGYWCDSGTCRAKITDGNACSGSNQCANGHCIDSVCCHTACAAPNTCATGTCSCNGAVCTSGHSCITWYLDRDGDGYGASSANDKVGCDDQQPADVNGYHYVKTSTDCDDANADAHPGQTGWFTAPRANGSYDYNCDGQQTQQYAKLLASESCHSCPSGGVACPACTIAHNSGYACTGSACQATVWQGFSTSVACGYPGTLDSCSSCTATEQSWTATQGCH